MSVRCTIILLEYITVRSTCGRCTRKSEERTRLLLIRSILGVDNYYRYTVRAGHPATVSAHTGTANHIEVGEVIKCSCSCRIPPDDGIIVYDKALSIELYSATTTV